MLKLKWHFSTLHMIICFLHTFPDHWFVPGATEGGIHVSHTHVKQFSGLCPLCRGVCSSFTPPPSVRRRKCRGSSFISWSAGSTLFEWSNDRIIQRRFILTLLINTNIQLYEQWQKILAVVYISFPQCEPDWGPCANFLSGSRCLRPSGPNHRTRINTEIAELFLSSLSSSRPDPRLLALRDVTHGTKCWVRLLWCQARTPTPTPSTGPNESRQEMNPQCADLRGRACFPPFESLQVSRLTWA